MGLELGLRELGGAPYEPTWHAMQHFVAERDKSVMDGARPLQHPAVLTQGQAGKAEHVLFPGNIPVIQVDRGGQMIYHGPDQLVTYLLFDVRRLGLGVRELISRIEQSLIGLLASYDVQAVAKLNAPGVYVDGTKIASLGLYTRNDCSLRGLALNLDMDLRPLRRTNPCGYAGMPMTQLHDLVGPVDLVEVCTRLRAKLVSRLGYAEQKTLTGGIELTWALLRRSPEKPNRARWKPA